MKRTCVQVLTGLAALSLLIPAAQGRSLKKDLKISLQEKRVQGMSAEGLTLGFVLEVANSSPDPCRLAGYDYRVLVENAEFFRLDRTLEAPLDIAPSGRTLVSLPVKLTYAYLFDTNPGLINKEKLDCTLVGGLIFAEEGKKGERLNVAMTAHFPVFKGFRTLIRPLEVRGLSVGGSDLTFRAEFQNLSAFGLEVESIHYRLELAAKMVAQGRAGGGRLEASGSTALTLPLLLEFFELGVDLFPLLQKSEADCRLSGELCILTPWGRHSVPFDQTLATAVRRVE